MNRYVKNVFRGVVFSLIIALFGVILLSLFMSKINISKNIFKMIYSIIILVSLSIGTILASKINGSKGYLIGIGVGGGYFFFILIIGLFIGNSFALTLSELGKFVVMIAVAVLSGMVGINTNK